jgi:hypothetical protein
VSIVLKWRAVFVLSILESAFRWLCGRDEESCEGKMNLGGRMQSWFQDNPWVKGPKRRWSRLEFCLMYFGNLSFRLEFFRELLACLNNSPTIDSDCQYSIRFEWFYSSPREFFSANSLFRLGILFIYRSFKTPNRDCRFLGKMAVREWFSCHKLWNSGLDRSCYSWNATLYGVDAVSRTIPDRVKLDCNMLHEVATFSQVSCWGTIWPSIAVRG